MEENKTNTQGKIGFYLGGVLSLVLLVLGIQVGMFMGKDSTSAVEASVATESPSSESTPSPTEVPEVPKATAEPEPTAPQAQGTADPLLEEIPTATETYTSTSYLDGLMYGKFAQNHVYYGAQSPIGELTHTEAHAFNTTVAGIGTYLGGKSDNWFWDATTGTWVPDIDLACYSLERGYYGCNHSAGFQIIIQKDTGWHAATVANKPEIANSKKFKDYREAGAYIFDTVDMELGSYPAYVNFKISPAYNEVTLRQAREEAEFAANYLKR